MSVKRLSRKTKLETTPESSLRPRPAISETGSCVASTAQRRIAGPATSDAGSGIASSAPRKIAGPASSDAGSGIASTPRKIAGPASSPERASSPAAQPQGMFPAATSPVIKREQGLPSHASLGEAPPIESGPAVNKSRGALRNAFRRSLGRLEDARTQRTGDRGTSTEKCPEHIAIQIVSKSDEDYWLQVWAANNMQWGQAKVWFNRKTENSEENNCKWTWMNGHQLDEHFGVKLAQKKRNKCMQDSDRWALDEDMSSDDSDAVLYYVQSEKSRSEKSAKVNSSGVEGTASVSAQSAVLLHGAMAVKKQRLSGARRVSGLQSTGPSGVGHNGPSMQVEQQHDAEEDQSGAADAEKEKAEKEEAEKEEANEEARLQKELDAESMKNVRKKQMEKKRKAQEADPAFQKNAWLQGIAKLVPDIDLASKKASKAAKLPAGTAKTYKKTFDQAYADIKAARDAIEGATVKKVLKQLLDGYKPMVEKAKKDLTAWKLLYNTYYADAAK